MRSVIGICFLVASALAPLQAAAQDAEALRKELEQMRKEFDTMKEGYEKAINNLSERIQSLESKQPPIAVPAVAPTSPSGGRDQMLTQAQPGVTINPAELARPREPFSLYERRGPGQLLFDMGVTGDFIGNLTQRNVQKAEGGTFARRENRFFPREIELNLFGQIDPYARAEVRFEAGEDTPGADITMKLAEATINLMTLPYGTQAKLGQMRNRFGLTNVIHEHDLPFIDRPNVFPEAPLARLGAYAQQGPGCRVSP